MPVTSLTASLTRCPLSLPAQGMSRVSLACCWYEARLPFQNWWVGREKGETKLLLKFNNLVVPSIGK